MKSTNNIQPQKFINVAFVFYALFIIFVMVIAYNGMVPNILVKIPFYDKIGHFLLIGFSSYLLNIVLNRHKIKFKNFSITTAPFLVLVFFSIEECFQLLSPVRTFDLTDLLSDFLGVYFFYIFDKSRLKSSK